MDFLSKNIIKGFKPFLLSIAVLLHSVSCTCLVLEVGAALGEGDLLSLCKSARGWVRLISLACRAAKWSALVELSYSVCWWR